MSLGSTLSWTNGASPKKRWCHEAGSPTREGWESPGFSRGEDVKVVEMAVANIVAARDAMWHSPATDTDNFNTPEAVSGTLLFVSKFGTIPA